MNQKRFFALSLTLWLTLLCDPASGQESAGLIHEEILKFYSDTGTVSDEAMQEFIANSKEAMKTSRDVSFSEIADFSFARRAVSKLREGR